MNDDDIIIDLESDVIDLEGDRLPTLVDITCSAAVRRAAARALQGLESHHGRAPWIAVCTATAEVIAASPSYDSDSPPDWKVRLPDAIQGDENGVPLVLLSLGVGEGNDDASVAAAELVSHALDEIVIAEHRAELALARADRAERLAATDALTGVGNQRAWWERIAEEDARIRRSEASAVIAVVDLDELKAVNDQRGHLHGDLLLRVAAETLREAVRSCDIVARVGGDEFAVLAVDFDGAPFVLQERIVDAFVEADISASVGVASPSPGMSLVDAYALADRAMYAQKRGRQHETSTDA